MQNSGKNNKQMLPVDELPDFLQLDPLDNFLNESNSLNSQTTLESSSMVSFGVSSPELSLSSSSLPLSMPLPFSPLPSMPSPFFPPQSLPLPTVASLPSLSSSSSQSLLSSSSISTSSRSQPLPSTLSSSKNIRKEPLPSGASKPIQKRTGDIFLDALNSISEPEIQSAINRFQGSNLPEFKEKAIILRNRLEIVQLTRKLNALRRTTDLIPKNWVPTKYLKQREELAQNIENGKRLLRITTSPEARKAIELSILAAASGIDVLNLKEQLELTMASSKNQLTSSSSQKVVEKPLPSHKSKDGINYEVSIPIQKTTGDIFFDALNSTSVPGLKFALNHFKGIATKEAHYKATILWNILQTMQLENKLRTENHATNMLAPRNPTMFLEKRRKWIKMYEVSSAKLKTEQSKKTSIEVEHSIAEAKLEMLLASTSIDLLNLREKVALITPKPPSFDLTQSPSGGFLPEVGSNLDLDPINTSTSLPSSSSISSTSIASSSSSSSNLISSQNLPLSLTTSMPFHKSLIGQKRKLDDISNSEYVSSNTGNESMEKEIENVFSDTLKSTSEEIIKNVISFFKTFSTQEFLYRTLILENRLETILLEKKLKSIGQTAELPKPWIPSMFINDRIKFAEDLAKSQAELQTQLSKKPSWKKYTEAELKILVTETSIQALNLCEKLILIERQAKNLSTPDPISSFSSSAPSTSSLSSSLPSFSSSNLPSSSSSSNLSLSSSVSSTATASSFPSSSSSLSSSSSSSSSSFSSSQPLCYLPHCHSQPSSSPFSSTSILWQDQPPTESTGNKGSSSTTVEPRVTEAKAETEEELVLEAAKATIHLLNLNLYLSGKKLILITPKSLSKNQTQEDLGNPSAESSSSLLSSSSSSSSTLPSDEDNVGNAIKGCLHKKRQ